MKCITKKTRSHLELEPGTTALPGSALKPLS